MKGEERKKIMCAEKFEDVDRKGERCLRKMRKGKICE